MEKEDKLRELISDALAAATKLGASAAEVAISSAEGFSVDVRLGEVETVEQHCDRGLTITVYFGQRSGTASTSDFRPETLNLTVKKAGYIARYTEEDPAVGLADAKLMAYDYQDLALCHPWQITVDEAISLGKECEAAGLRCDPKITNSEGANVSTVNNMVGYGNTHGFSGFCPSTIHSISCALIATQNTDMQRDYDFTVARNAGALMAAETIGKNAAQRTVARLDAKHLTTRKIPVIFDPQMARSLISDFIDAVSGRNLYNRTTFLVDSLGTKIFPDHLTIAERPHLLQALGSSAFDAEGVRTYDRYLVDQGVLQGYVLNSYAARKLKMATTANAGGIHNLIISSKHNYSLPDLLKLMGTGLVVTELLGQGVNLITGDYSRGAFGFWVENGVIQYPVEGITIAGNLRDLFLGISAMANDVDERGAIRVGSILVDRMTVAGGEKSNE